MFEKNKTYRIFLKNKMFFELLIIEETNLFLKGTDNKGLIRIINLAEISDSTEV